MSSSRRALLLAGVLGLTLLVALVTISATAQSGSRAIALEEEIPVEDEAPAFTEEVNAEEKEEEPPAEQAAVAEEPVDVPEDEKHDPHMHYAMLHPVYTRCAKKADMHSFVELVVKSCGDIHELDTCSEPCAAAMRGYSEHVGCCWETVMHAYKTLDAQAHLAWRHWQGTLSGKCGITFSDDSCGDAQGEHGYNSLKNKVQELQHEAEMNSQYINDLYYQHYFSNGGNGDDAYGDEDDYYKNGQEGANEEPPHLKSPGSDERDEEHVAYMHKDYSLSQKNALGDEVFDLPVMGGHDDGDVHVPAESIKPFSFSHHRMSHKKGSIKLSAYGRMNQLSEYDDYRNYQNSLRLGTAYKKIAKKGGTEDPFFQWPGDSWTKKTAQQQQLTEGGFPLAQGVIQGAVGDGMYGQGGMSQAALDPVNGHPLIEDSPDEDHKYRLTDEAAIRQAKYEREHSRASTPLSWLDHSEDVPASPGYDAGRYKLDRFGVRT